MKILFISKYSQLYGANRSLLTIVEYFKTQGDEVCVMIPTKGDFGESLKRKGISYFNIPYFSQILYFKKSLKFLSLPLLFIYDIFIFPLIIIKVKKYNPDLIYSNAAAENLGILIAKCLHKKHISHIREFMDLDFKATFLGGNKIREKFLNLSDGLIFVSKSVQSHVMNNNIHPSKQTVIYNGIDSPDFPYETKTIKEDLNLGIVGVLDVAKRQDLAIRYFNELLRSFPNLKLHIWGDKESPYKKELLKLVEQFNIKENVIFHGFEKNTSKIYQSMDVLLMFSYAEGFGRVTIEAMLYGIPVIGFNNGGTSEIIEHGYNGFLFKTKEEFLSCFNELISDQNNYNQIRKNAYLSARKNFNTELYTKKVYSFTKKILSK